MRIFMNIASPIAFGIWIGALLTLMSCQKACSSKDPDVAPVVSANNGQVDSLKKPDHITTFSTLNLTELTNPEKEALIKLLNEEICPCGCPKTFAQCLQMKTGCKPGEILAEWIVNKVKEGVPEPLLLKAVSEEINTGYLAEPKTIDTKNAYHKGHPKAPITIVEFADFECPGCRLAAVEMREFFKAHSDDVQLYFMHFPLTSHPHAERAAIAAEAAGKQGKFWEMHDLLFTHDGPLTDSAIRELAMKLFDQKHMVQFDKDLADPAILQKIKDQKDYGANHLKLEATPTFFFNGRPYNLYSKKDGFQLRFNMEKYRSEIDCHKE